jgi:hypothetical protein
LRIGANETRRRSGRRAQQLALTDTLFRQKAGQAAAAAKTSKCKHKNYVGFGGQDKENRFLFGL